MSRLASPSAERYSPLANKVRTALRKRGMGMVVRGSSWLVVLDAPLAGVKAAAIAVIGSFESLADLATAYGVVA